MLQRVEAKANAKAQLKGRWGAAIGAFLLAELVVLAGIGVIVLAFILLFKTMGAAALFIVPLVGVIVISIIGSAIPLGIHAFTLKVASGEKPNVGVVLSGFKNILKAWCLNFVTAFFTSLWSMLFVIPGIIKAISYSMAMYVLAENPEIGVMEALKRSKEMTKGNKGKLFVTYLSFIGWTFVCNFTMGIGYLWLIPYMQVTLASIYNQLKGESVQVGEAGVAL